ncbi:MAG: hypothetical protein A3F83_14300 [Candidatus Glassbacteria bacterium RIFCSPLOWO2_12_FULL_58_11]|uniref:Inosine/uridine-preferring nucleoside hydrolase domain-containing protein n=1 Tax=Candidatus Glassbacteria bacterium RIFCSPLOWO2_12_FULL_58_11 TaxID=1817867 RepID=A0A1F5YZC4_9BACT|nr:MAG: hypothetical protein A3F83_14300 [Candidatus Glassbacteria bacterium RIFCSPLOWO2_12_FULL_58_11]
MQTAGARQCRGIFSLALTILLLCLGPSPLRASMRLIIDTDAACERDDQHAIAYAILCPEYFKIEGITAVHNGPGTLEKNFLEVHTVLGLAGVGGIPVVRGAGEPLSSMDKPVDSEAARFIIERSKVKAESKLVVLGLGAATNLASSILLDPTLKERVVFAWIGGAGWPEGQGGEYNSLQDLAAMRVLFSSGVELKLIPCGNNVMFQTRYHSARNFRGVSPLGDYLNLLMTANRYTMDEPFNIADLAAAGVLAHPEYAKWLSSPAPWIDERGGYDWSRTFGRISVATSLVEHVYGGPIPIWQEFYRKAAESAPREPANLREELCQVLNIHPDPPDVQPVEGKIEKFNGFTRQEVLWPTIFGETVPAYVCKPLNTGERKLPAVVCLSGTHGDRFVDTEEFFGIADYASIGRENEGKAPRLHGWAAELARRGYLTLAMTQRGLGDRGWTGDKQSKAMIIEGFTEQGVHAHEIRQALTYLSRRADVDPQRIGCTGFSFGGITTFYTTAADSRFKAAAPICGGIGSLRVILESGNPGYHGVYWWIPGILQHFDQAELVASQAPRPYFIGAPLKDVGMPKEAVDELLAKVSPAYERAGAPGALVTFRPDGPHEFGLEMFAELVKFFDKYL